MIRVIGFLQCPNLPKGHRIVLQYRNEQNLHRRLLSMSPTGKRLQEAFKDYYNQIYWDNANPEPCTNEPNYAHIQHRLSEVKPHLILAFGRIASKALIEIDAPAPLWCCKHPMARGLTQQEIDNFAMEVVTWTKNQQHLLLVRQAPEKLRAFSTLWKDY